MIDDTPPADSAVPPNTQMYFASSYTDITLAEWLKDPASTDMFDAAFTHAAATSNSLLTVTVGSVGSFEIVTLLDPANNYDHVVRINTDDPWAPWSDLSTSIASAAEVWSTVEDSLETLGINRGLVPASRTSGDRYWYAVLTLPAEPGRRRLTNGNYLSDDGDGVAREWDRAGQLVNVERSV